MSHAKWNHTATSSTHVLSSTIKTGCDMSSFGCYLSMISYPSISCRFCRHLKTLVGCCNLVKVYPINSKSPIVSSLCCTWTILVEPHLRFLVATWLSLFFGFGAWGLWTISTKEKYNAPLSYTTYYSMHWSMLFKQYPNFIGNQCHEKYCRKSMY